MSRKTSSTPCEVATVSWTLRCAVGAVAPREGSTMMAEGDGEVKSEAVEAGAGGHAGLSALDRGLAACLEAVERVKDLYDRVRTAVDESLAGVVRAVRAGADAARRADRDLAAAGRALRRAGDALDRGLQDARRDVARALKLMRQHGR